MKNSGDLTETYRERLWPSTWLLLAITPLGAAIWLASLPFIAGVGLWIGAAVVLAVWLFLFSRAARITVGGGQLSVDSAVLPTSAVGEVRVVSGSEATAARGPMLDPRAYTLFRAGVSTYVWIEIKDENDPTPYWLVATRQPQILERALKLASS
ncbi:MAG: hypothetical protein RLZZ626_942 [Actinomycetota bacterium]